MSIIIIIIIVKSVMATRDTFSSSELSTQPSTISTKLSTYDATANLLTTNLSANKPCHLLTTVSTHLLAAASGNLSVPTNLNTVTELTSKQNPKAETDTTKLKIIDEDAISTKPETNQKPLTSNIPPATISNNGSLAAIFLFELEKPVKMPLFSGAVLELKLITATYTNTKFDELRSCPMKITGHKHTITASCATENDMATQNNKASKTTNYVSLVRNNYSTKECGIIFLDKKKRATLYANTQSLLVTE
ncbi:hypothetical protein G9A89_001570 [Geosiphon pyriformis]|nr:hypothetical protein G9A89_001570 [Geosiphon pyriformis]